MNRRSRRNLVTAAAAATILGLGVALWAAIDDEPPANSSGDTTSDDDNADVGAEGAECVVVAQGNDSAVTVNCGEESATTDDVEAWEELRKQQPWLTAADPPGQGPWPYIVGGTGGEGLYVRDGYNQEDSRLEGEPTLHDGKPLYAYCHESNGWEAVPGYGPVWLRSGYPQPRDSGDHWVYSWWTVPVEHSGRVPECQDS